MELKIDVENHKKHPRTDDELPSKKNSANDNKLPFKSLKKNDDELSYKYFKKNDDDELDSKSSIKNNFDELSTESSNLNDQFETFNDFNRLERKYVECNVCQKICADESALRRHCVRHLYQNITTCGVCSNKFPSVYLFHEHFKSHRSDIYACNKCFEQFTAKEYLSNHVCSKAYPCNVCNHIFKSKDDLLNHFYIHKSLQGSYLHFTND